MAQKINIQNLNNKKEIQLKPFRKVAEVVLKALKKQNRGVNVIFTSSQKIRGINRKYLRLDSSTDVIAFPSSKIKHFIDAGVVPDNSLGDIVISTDVAARNAKVYKTDFHEETALYLIHGLLHLAGGFEDKTVKGRKLMRKKENELIEKTRRYF